MIDNVPPVRPLLMYRTCSYARVRTLRIPLFGLQIPSQTGVRSGSAPRQLLLLCVVLRFCIINKADLRHEKMEMI